MPNYQVMKMGLAFPVGAVVAPEAISHPDWLLSQHAIAPTALEPTVRAPHAAAAALPAPELAAENGRLKGLLAALPGENAALLKDAEAAEALRAEAEARAESLAKSLSDAQDRVKELETEARNARAGLKPAK